MISQFSPFTQRLLALALLIFGLLGSINIVALPLFGFVGQSLTELADTRFRLAKVRQIKARPERPVIEVVPPGLAIMAASRDVAVDQFRTQLTGLATRFALQIETVPSATPSFNAANIEISILVKGDEEKILSFINGLEQSQPLIRLRTWSLVRENGSSGIALQTVPIGANQPQPASNANVGSTFDPNGTGPNGIGSAALATGLSIPTDQSDYFMRLDAVAIAAWASPS